MCYFDIIVWFYKMLFLSCIYKNINLKMLRLILYFVGNYFFDYYLLINIFFQGIDEFLVEKLNIYFGGNSYYGKLVQLKFRKFIINYYVGKVCD